DLASVHGPGIPVAAVVGAQRAGAGLVIGGERDPIHRLPRLVADGKDALRDRPQPLAGEGEGGGIVDVVAAGGHAAPVVPAAAKRDGIDGVVVRVHAERVPGAVSGAELHQVRPDVAVGKVFAVD